VSNQPAKRRRITVTPRSYDEFSSDDTGVSPVPKQPAKRRCVTVTKESDDEISSEENFLNERAAIKCLDLLEITDSDDEVSSNEPKVVGYVNLSESTESNEERSPDDENSPMDPCRYSPETVAFEPSRALQEAASIHPTNKRVDPTTS
jgi:hypothetical protein